jgi:hypothetical protein
MAWRSGLVGSSRREGWSGHGYERWSVRLHARYRRLTARGKCKQQVVTAIGRELLGFIWAIGIHVESETGRVKLIAA